MGAHRLSASQHFTPLCLEFIGATGRNAATYRLHEPLHFTAGFDGGGVSVRVPAGFQTDLTSIPRWLRSWLPHDGQYAPAAVTHDYLYSLCRAGEKGCSRFLADAIFRDGMRLLGVPMLRRVVIYYAVRFFGAGAAKRKRKAKR